MRNEVYLTTLEVMSTCGFWQIMKFVWGIPLLILIVIILCKQKKTA